MTYTERALQLRPVIEQAAQSLEDVVALTSVELFPHWDELVKKAVEVEKGFRFQYKAESETESKLYRTEQPRYTFVKHEVPGSTGTESLFSKVDDTHKGTFDDPIPYDGNMEIYESKYYTQNEVLYLCIRDSGQPLYHDLESLIGIYVEVVV